MKFGNRILAAFGLHRSATERELDDELRSHVERRSEELRREGLGAAEARRRALVELGGVQQIKEEVRAMRGGVWLETLWQDVRYGGRSLRRNPGFAAVAVLTLALGIGANTAVFSLLDTVLLKQLPVRDPAQLVLLDWIAGPKWLHHLSAATGGRAYVPEDAKDFRRAYAQIAQFVRGEYTLEFVPTSLDGRLRSIRVKVKRPGYRIHHRQAYLALPSPPQ